MAARLGIGADGDRARAQRKALLGEDDATTVFETSKEVTVITTFDQMSLKEDLLRGIYAYGFERPSAIQQRSIKPMVAGRDVIAQAQSGTGKTATFAIAMLQKVDIQLRETQALVLSPTRELAVQIQKVSVFFTLQPFLLQFLPLLLRLFFPLLCSNCFSALSYTLFLNFLFIPPSLYKFYTAGCTGSG
jgi:hypothetical protein